MRILIVEDEVKIRNGMARLISNHTGHTVVGEGRNGEEGLEMAKRLAPDLIITDIRMPKMDGLEMIERLTQQGVHCHFAILSGYSEFDYAHRALRYGVDDYLLKPLAVEDIEQLLRRVQEKLDIEERRIEGTPEGFLRDLLLSGEPDADLERKLEKLLQKGTEPLYLLCGYLGDTEPAYREACLCALKAWKQKMEAREPGGRVYYILPESAQELFVVCHLPNRSGQDVVSGLTRRLIQTASGGKRAVFVFGATSEQAGVRETGAALRRLYPYGMVLNTDHFLTREECAGYQARTFSWPYELGNRIRETLCNDNTERFREALREFLDAMRRARCAPDELAQGYRKMIRDLHELERSVNPEIGRTPDWNQLLADAARAITRGELESCLEKEAAMILAARSHKEDIRSYAIRRAIGYIREHYRESITLEEVAQTLEITPEYLSTLFRREVGIHFSAFLRRFRVSHAKRLLKGSDMKIYEIAEAVGYGDPKYFNRVFKEETGVSPGDYRTL